MPVNLENSAVATGWSMECELKEGKKICSDGFRLEDVNYFRLDKQHCSTV